MSMNIKENTFYSVIRYRLLSHILRGGKSVYYKNKYKFIKNILKDGKKENYYIFKIRVASIVSINNIKCYKIFGLPIVVTSQKENCFFIKIFGIPFYSHTNFKNKNIIAREIVYNNTYKDTNINHHIKKDFLTIMTS